MKKKVLILDLGGTISQKINKSGVLSPSEDFYIDKVPALSELAFIEYKNIKRIDSVDLKTSDRAQVAKIIFANRNEFDGFVIVQGTDTLADSASCLNYMIQDIGKPIVLTGAQLSIFGTSSDAAGNLFNSVLSAISDFGEILICFGNKVFRGCKTIKENVFSFQAFSSPQSQELAEIGIELRYTGVRIKRKKETHAELFVDFYEGIYAFKPISGIDSSNLLKSVIEREDIKGVLIESFGSGNLGFEYRDCIKLANNLGKVVLIISRAQRGVSRSGIYESGHKLIENGALTIIGMTFESASQKLMYAIGKAIAHNSTTDFRKNVIKILKTPIGMDMN